MVARLLEAQWLGGVESSDPLAEKPIVEMDVPLDDAGGRHGGGLYGVGLERGSGDPALLSGHLHRPCAKGNR